ncbi:MAG: M20 family metallopeptidase [Firmicutes bacterium]|nr:M20 family metallopeptidase [Bacillota bacterium]
MQTERLLKLYKDLIRIPSVVGEEEEVAAFLADHLTAAGFEVQVHRYGEEARPNVVARLKGEEAGPKILLSGHLDTVPVHDGWETDPFQPVEEGDRVYGLGACDMKGGLAAMIEAARSLAESGEAFRGEIILGFTSDEEGRSEGTYSLIQDGLIEADMAVVGECRFNPMVLGFRGRYSLDIEVRGEVAHASEYPLKGENALINAARLAIGLEELPVGEHPAMGKGSACLRYFSGGEPRVLKVPDYCKLLYERYVVPGESQEQIWEQVQKLVSALGLAGKVSVSWSKRKGPFLEGFAVSEDEEIVRAAAAAFQEVTGEKPGYGYDPSVCDANYISQLMKIPVLTFGPSGANWHAPNEYGLKSQVIAAAQVYLGMLQRLLT